MTHDGFLQAILDDSDDDSLRLIYADWLEERGDPRGEFIRIQCELARGMNGTRRSPLVQREQQLLRLHEDEWTSSVCSLMKRRRRGFFNWKFIRGFIEEVWLDPRHSLAGIDELFQLAPIRCLAFQMNHEERTFPGEYRALFPCALANCPLLKRVVSLEVSFSHLGSDGIQALIFSDYLDNLKSLNLHDNRIGDGGARALAGSSLLERLEKLDLSNNAIGPVGVRALASALAAQGETSKLRSLGLQGNPLRATGMRVILDSPILRRVAEW